MKTTYYSKHRSTLLAVGVFTILITLLRIAETFYSNLDIQTFPIPLIALGIILIGAGQSNSLYVSPDGIAQHLFGMKICFSRWDDLEKLTTINKTVYIQSKKLVRDNKWFAFFSKSRLVPNDLDDKLIPYDEWDNLPLLQKEIRHYASHIDLFDY